MATKIHTNLTKSHKDPRGNSLGSRPNKGASGNPENYTAERLAFKTGTMFKKGGK